jgi:hypothetical protein
MDDDSYSGALNKILQTARGSLTDIEEFENNEEGDNSIPEIQINTDNNSVGRTNLRKLAAIMAVLSIPEEVKDVKAIVGRQLGSAWAQDHRRTAMGLSGLAYNRAKRSTWR